MTYPFYALPAGTTLYHLFGSYAAATGAPSTMSGFATSDILIYKNGSVTQRSSTAGFTLLDTDGIDFDSLTGINGFSIDLSDNTDAGFYAAGSIYHVVISTVTIDSQAVSFVACAFRIGVAENTAGTPVVDLGRIAGSTVSASTAQLGVNVVNIAGSAVTAASGVPEVKVQSIAANAITATAIAADAITDAKVAADVTIASVTGAVGSVTGAVGSVTGAVGSVTGAVGSVTGNVGGNVTGSVGSLAAQAKADVNAEVVDALATDIYAEPAAVPGATVTLAAKIGWLYTLSRNKFTQTATTTTLRNNTDAGTIGTATVSDDGTTFTQTIWS